MGQDEQVQDGSPAQGDEAIRELIRSAVSSNGGVPVASLKDLYDSSGVPHIKMGQLRKLMADSLAKLQRENEEYRQKLEEERERAESAAREAGAARERAGLMDRINELEEQLKRLQTESDNERELNQNEIQRLNSLLASVDLKEGEERLRRIAELEEQLAAMRDALSEARQEIRRLLSELRYAEPIITPDHGEVSSSAKRVRDASRQAGRLGIAGERAVHSALRYVDASEEMCQAELPKLQERMNGREASFPAVFRMVKLATLHQEHRRWLGVLDQVLAGK